MKNQELQRPHDPMPAVRGEGISLEAAPCTKTVMIIEDHYDFHQSLSLRLRASGVRVISAYDGFGGLCGIIEAKPDLVVLDLGLPDLNGLELMHFLRSTPGMQQVPVIVLTGSTDATIEEQALALGVRRVLYKPVRQRAVVHTILELLCEE